MVECRMCGCTTVFDNSGRVCSVSTCPLCLPRGAITWLVDNGRQLELFEEEGVTGVVRSREEIEKYAQDQVQTLPEGELPF